MRLIKQFDDDGCGLACTAMAAGTTYRAVRNFAFPDGEVESTSTRRLREIMEAHGVKLGKRLVPFRGKHPSDLGFNALLKVNVRRNGSEWHWVLWDCERKKVLDPRRPPYKRLRYTSYVQIFIHKTPSYTSD